MTNQNEKGFQETPVSNDFHQYNTLKDYMRNQPDDTPQGLKDAIEAERWSL